jgi:uncharacterized membrane protein
MTFFDHLNLFLVTIPASDWFALAWFAVCWIGYTVYASREGRSCRSLIRGTDRMRMAWMERLLEREVRLLDSGLLGNLMHSVSFFASTAMLIIGSLIAALGAVDHAMQWVANLGLLAAAGREAWTLKLIALIVVFIYAFFKLTWSLRQFNRCAILIGAAPPHDQLDDSSRRTWARRLGRLNALAGDDFNCGLRAYYFGLALLAWFVHPGAFAGASVWVVVVLYRREFASEPVVLLSEDEEGGE